MRIATIGSFAPIALVVLLSTHSAHAQKAAETDGLYFTIQNPIKEGQITQIKADVDAARGDRRRNIKKVIFDFNPEGREAATDSYGPCGDLADYIRTLSANGLTTIAFVHGKTTRHTVLPVIACEDLVMAAGAEIGQVAGGPAPVTKIQTDHYLALAGIPRAGAVLKMIDKDVKLYQAQYKGSVIYVDIRKVEGPNADPAYAEVRITKRTPEPMAPGIELYGVEKARQYGLCKLQKDTLDELLAWYELPASILHGDPLRGKALRPVRVMVEGAINTALREKVRRQVQAAKGREENMFFFVLETTAGGDLQAARGLADDLLALGKDPDYPARTIAFVPGKAPDLAIFLALACQDRVMYLGPAPENEAVLGDFDTYLGGPKGKGANEKFVRDNLADLAAQTGQSKLIIDGLFDANLVIVRARNDKTGDRQLMSLAEVEAQKGEWKRESSVKEKGTLLKLTASKARDLRLARTIDNKDIAEVYALYGVDSKDVRASEPSWLDDFAAFLRRTEVSILLVIVGIAGLVLELKAPGLIIPGVIAAICFILFFWAQTQLGGQLIYLAIMLFLLGLALLGVEIFLIPGFGVTGVSGILLILTGLVLAGLDKAPESTADWVEIVGRMLRYGLTMAGAVVLAFLVSRFLPKIPYANRLMLVPPEDKADTGDELPQLPGVAAAVALLGQVGTSMSTLRPAGLAQFGDKYVDVVTEGDFIPSGTPIQVVEVEGTRIVVKRV